MKKSGGLRSKKRQVASHGGDVVRLWCGIDGSPKATPTTEEEGEEDILSPSEPVIKTKIGPLVRLSSGACATSKGTRRVLPAGARNRPEGKDRVYLGGGEGSGRSEEVTRRASSPSRTPCFWA